MTWEAWVTILVIVLMILALARNWAGPDVIVLGALALLMTIASLARTDLLPSPAAAVRGFGNEGLITVAVLYVVTSGLIRTGAMNLAAATLMGRHERYRSLNT